MGRKKMRIEFIANDSYRKSIYTKRIKGLKKKAFELHTLCGVDVVFICLGLRGQIETWPEDPRECKRITTHFKGLSKPERTRREQNLTKFFQDMRKNCNKQVAKHKGEHWLNGFSEESLLDLIATLDAQIGTMNEVIELRKKNNSAQEKELVLISEPPEIQCYSMEPLLMLPGPALEISSAGPSSSSNDFNSMLPWNPMHASHDSNSMFPCTTTMHASHESNSILPCNPVYASHDFHSMLPWINPMHPSHDSSSMLPCNSVQASHDSNSVLPCNPLPDCHDSNSVLPCNPLHGVPNAMFDYPYNYTDFGCIDLVQPPPVGGNGWWLVAGESCSTTAIEPMKPFPIIHEANFPPWPAYESPQQNLIGESSWHADHLSY